MRTISQRDAEAATTVHEAADVFNRALRAAHEAGLRIDLRSEGQGEPERYPSHGGEWFEVRGTPPSITVEVSLPLPVTRPPEPPPSPSSDA